MSVTIRAGETKSFRAYCDASHWSELQAAGVTASDLKAAVAQSLGVYANVTQLNVDVFNSWLQAASVGLVVTVTPSADIATGDASDPRALWEKALNPVPTVTPVLPLTSLGAAILFGLNAVALSHRVGTTDAPAFRARTSVIDAPMVIDDTTISAGLVQAVPQASPNDLANFFRGTNKISSTDPARDGTTGLGNAAREAGGFQIPTAAWIVGGVVLGLVALVALGYATRGVAQVAREL